MMDLLQSLIFFPLTAGHGGRRNYKDGHISSATLTSALISFTVTTTFIFSKRQFTKGPSDVLWVLYSSKNLMTIVCVIILFVVFRKRKHLYEQSHDHARWRKIVFLCLFSVPSLLHNSFSIAISVFCLAANGSYVFKGDEIIGILSRLVSIIFIVSEVLLASMYSKYNILSSKTTNYCIFFIILSNLTEWFKTVLREIVYPERPHIHHNDSNIKYSNSCYANSEVKKFEDEYLYPSSLPLETEFSFMITLMFLGFLSDKSAEDHNGGHPVRTSFTEDANNYAVTSGQTSVPSLMRSASTWLGIVFSAPYLFTAMIAAYRDGLSSITDIYGAVEMSFLFTVMAFVMSGFHCLRKHCVQGSFEHISSEELLLMFSNFGYGMYKVFNIATFLSGNHQFRTWEILIFPRHFVAFIFAFYQTVFILQAERSVYNEGTPMSRKVNMRTCCFLLHILNLVLWFTSTFPLEHILLRSKYETLVLGKHVWEHIVRIFQPIIAFYHFHSAIEFYGFYRKFMNIPTRENEPLLNVQ